MSQADKNECQRGGTHSGGQRHCSKAWEGLCGLEALLGWMGRTDWLVGMEGATSGAWRCSPGESWQDMAMAGVSQLGRTATRRVCQNSPEASMFWLDKVYVHPGSYKETAGITLV